LAETAEDKQLLIERAHVVESVVDVIKLDGSLPVDWKQKLNDYHSKYFIFVSPCSNLLMLSRDDT